MENIEAVEKTIASLKEGWGANCETPDYCDVEKDTGKSLVGWPKNAQDYVHWLDARCQSCRAKEVIDFLTEHLSMLKGEYPIN